MKWLSGVLLIMLAACSATAPQYYSLQAPYLGASAIQSDYAISVEPVLIPQQVARPQIVVSTESGVEVIPLNAALWAGPLEAQIRNTLADSLSRRLNVVDVARAGAPEDIPVWRVYVDVQRFDSIYDIAVQQDVVWRMVPEGVAGRTKERTCSAQIRVPIGTGMAALVEGHRRVLERLASLVAQSLPPKGGDVSPTLSNDVKFRGCVN